MSCCGTPRDTSEGQQRLNQPVTPFHINQQPGMNQQPGWPPSQEKQFQPQGVHAVPTPPPAAQSPYSAQMNGYDSRMSTYSPHQAAPSHPGSPFQQPPGPPNGSISNMFNPYNPSQSPPIPPASPPVIHPHTPTPASQYNPGYGSMSPIQRPTAMLANGYQAEPYNPQAAQTTQATADSNRLSLQNDGKLVVSIDFGTTMSGVSYGSTRIAAGSVQQVLNWPGTQDTYRKIPTCLLYDDTGRVLSWGVEAKSSGPITGTYKCEWFKLYLEPAVLRDESNIDPRLPPLPPNKRPVDLIVDFLSNLWDYAKQEITQAIGAVADLDSADVWLTVPAAWDAAGCGHMRDAAMTAGLVRSAGAGDTEWRDRLRIITEPEAAAVHCASLTDLHRLKSSQSFMICDAGGGTVDLAVYKVLGNLQHLEIAELCARSGANCGSIFLDLRFQELVKTLLADHPVHLDPPSLANFMHIFSDEEKLAYGGEADDDQMFSFTCFNPHDPHDPSVGLINGDLVIPGNLLRREVFDPVVDQVITLIETQAAKIPQPVDALLLVGGFAGCEYLFKRVDERFGPHIKTIARPSDADTATLRGAAQYGLARRPLVSSVIAPRSYLMKVKLPAEEEDKRRRPAYIRENDAGVQICENRLQYLVVKGAILRKGQRLKTKFCKFSANANDRTFVADLYTSETDQILRYTDEGQIQDLCKWTVDLGTLPTFRHYSQLPHPNGFYTDFELGLELDSAEVRGVLLHQGQEWGRVVFDFLS